MRQTTEIDLQRALVLLRAARDLLRTCEKGPYVKNALEELTFYDGCDCEGIALVEEIEGLLEIGRYEPVLAGGGDS
jgi:hypothetical protein